MSFATNTPPEFALPVISFVGKSDSGKTTFLEKLITLLCDRGIHVATVKHHVHEMDVDIVGKDSWRHAQAGAQVTMVSSPVQYSVIKRVKEKATLKQLACEAQRSGMDILISEGYKNDYADKIELSRFERSTSAVCEPSAIVALVTDNDALAREYSDEGVLVFGLDDACLVAEFVCDRYLKGVCHDA